MNTEIKLVLSQPGGYFISNILVTSHRVSNSKYEKDHIKFLLIYIHLPMKSKDYNLYITYFHGPYCKRV